MNVDKHVVLLTGAINAAVQGGTLNRDKLLKNVDSCFLRVKKELSSLEAWEQQFDDFHVRAILILLLSCPRIHQLTNICESVDFNPIVSTLPVVHEADFFAVVRKKKSYRFLAPLLSWLPPHVIKDILKEYFLSVVDVTPVTLAVSVELLKSLLFSYQYTLEDDVSDIHCSEWLKPLTDFLSTKIVCSETETTIRSSGFYYLYLCECLYLMLSVYTGCPMQDPDGYSPTDAWSKLWNTKRDQPKINVNKCCSISGASIKVLMNLCQNNINALSVEVWMAWSDINLSANIHIHRQSIHEHVRAQPQSVQSVICNIAFDVLKLMEGQHDLSEALALDQHSNLIEFFKQVASDPDYDPDQDWNVAQLVEQINRLQMKNEGDGRLKKLLGMLVMKDDIFTTKEPINCLQNNKAQVIANDTMHLLLQFIQVVKSDSPCDAEWFDVCLELVKDLPSVELLSVVEQHLSSGTDERLLTPHFPQQLTAVFNRVAGEDATDFESGERVAWLCLQSGQAVVNHAVTLSLTLTGLVPIMVQSLNVIAPVCRASLPSGISVLLGSLFKQQERRLSERESRDFIILVESLLKSPEKPLTPTEVVKVLVEPFLVLKKGMSSIGLHLPIELLKAALNDDMSAVMKPGAELLSLMWSLVQIANSAVYLQGNSALDTLKLRTKALQVVDMIVKAIFMEKETHYREISLLKDVVIGQCHLHPRILHPLFPLLGTECRKTSGLDQVLWELMDVAEQGKCKIVKNWSKKRALSLELKQMSRAEWILALIQLLPHSTEEEWTAAVFLTHHRLQSQGSVFQTLSVFQEVLFLLCSLSELSTYPSHEPEEEKEKGLEKEREKICNGENQNAETEDGNRHREEKPVNEMYTEEEGKNNQTTLPANIPSVSVSMQHCFQCFASAAMLYTEMMVQHLSAKQKFVYMCSLFRWWCCQMTSYQCDPELPTLLLSRLCAAIEDMIASGTVKVNDNMKSECLDTKKKNLVNGIVTSEKVQIDAKLAGLNTEIKNLENCITGGLGVQQEDVLNTVKGFNDINRRDPNYRAVENETERHKTLTHEVGTKESQRSCNITSSKQAVDIDTGILNVTHVNRKNIHSQDPSDVIRSSMTSTGNTCENGGSAILNETTDTGSLPEITSNYATEHNLKINIYKGDVKDIKSETEQLMWSVVKYAPPSHLMASVANKLKKLYEVLSAN
ncbi:hypothetical protein Pcinc_028702 [Petrolisthes cinctipes]|uniref:Uncharacterized protein n=1 Tax=Petrolisthes cinctipes TaxID=88211 RepID=A0AAE1K511_PETCI|nr:hypothetical protein Pcinc_028702 [Petrolisthes cinctipes]